MISNKEDIIKEILAKNLDKLEEYTETVNKGKTFFTKNDYNIIEGVPQYYEIDEYGRTSGAIAIISRNTLSIRTEKHLKYSDPSGWSKIISNSCIFQRCHCIAYRLSAKKNDKRNPFNDKGYICCSTYGNSRSRSFHQKYYKQLLQENNLPNIRFHDLRHTYSTILLKANFDVKAVSQLLGHASEIITVDVYCEKEKIIFDCLDILEPFIESVLPDEKEKGFIYDYSNDEEINSILNEYLRELLVS